MRLQLLPILLLCVALAACGDLPQPFKPAGKSAQTWAGTGIDAGLDAWGSVLVRPVTGLPAPLAATLAAETVDALLAREMPASERSASRASISLAGRIGVASGTLHWTLVAPDGETVARFDEPRPRKGWGGATAPEIEAVAARAAGRVEAVLAPPRVVAAGARRMAPVVVSQVSGAPGDGGLALALARAMRHALARIGIAGAPAEDEAALRVSGEVSIAGNETAPEGADVTIAWRVTRADGAEIGTVTQSNRVPAEILEGRWGPLARTVAQAGAPGIARLARRVPAPEAPATPRLTVETPAMPETAAAADAPIAPAVVADAPMLEAPIEPWLTARAAIPPAAAVEAPIAPAVAAESPGRKPPLAVSVTVR